MTTNKAREFSELVNESKKIVVIQAENPDGDSLGSSLALEEILSDLGKEAVLYCPVIIPRYLRFVPGWDRVVDELPVDFDLSIIVDTSAATLLEKLLTPENTASLKKHPVTLLDHHDHPNDIPLETVDINSESAASTGELIFELCQEFDWKVSQTAGEMIITSIMFDTLGLTTESTTARTVEIVSNLVKSGVSLSDLENRRRQSMKKSPRILSYKAELINRIDYALDGRVAHITIPWEEIEKYSDEYNPSMLVLEEMRMTEGVLLAVAYKTYPDGKLTAKLRANPEAPIAKEIATKFGGGGHPQAAGFKIRDSDFDQVHVELLSFADKLLGEDHA